MNETQNLEPVTPAKKKPLSSVKKRPKPRKKIFGWWLTLLLWLVLAALLAVLWALFISGPARIHDEQIARVKQAIVTQVPDIEGLSENAFDYVTWQGYTDQTLYWFDAAGGEITQRPISSLDYEGARKKAQQYNMEPDTITLAYGYSAPVYQLESKERILMLDYDTLEWVYERNLNP